jgi:hypothetical protein
VNILAVVEGDMILNTDLLCSIAEQHIISCNSVAITLLLFLLYLFKNSSMQSLLRIVLLNFINSGEYYGL